MISATNSAIFTRIATTGIQIYKIEINEIKLPLKPLYWN